MLLQDDGLISASTHPHHLLSALGSSGHLDPASALAKKVAVKILMKDDQIAYNESLLHHPGKYAYTSNLSGQLPIGSLNSSNYNSLANYLYSPWLIGCSQ